MYFFQVTTFILEIVFGLIIGETIAIFPHIFLGNKYIKTKKIKIIGYNVTDNEDKNILKIIGRSIWFVIITGITVYFLKNYLLDLPKLIKGDFN